MSSIISQDVRWLLQKWIVKPWVLILIFSVYILYRFTYKVVLYPRFFSPLRNIPGPPLSHFIYGTLKDDMRDNAASIKHGYVKEHGSVVRMVGPIGMERLMFTRPEALKRILVTEWLDNPRPKHIRTLLGFVTGYGLLTVTGDEHKQMRKAINPAFSLSNLSAQTGMYYETIGNLISVLRREIASSRDPSEGKVILMYDWISKATLDIICETAFGYKTNALFDSNNELAQAYHTLVSWQSRENLLKVYLPLITPGVPRFMMSKWAFEHQAFLKWLPFIGATTPVIDSMYRIRRISREMLSLKIQEAEQSGVSADDTATKKDIMSILVRARMANRVKEEAVQAKMEAIVDEDAGYGMSDQAMLDQVLTFLGAGHETTASHLAWTLFLLAKYPEVQTRLREEVLPVLAEDPHPDYRTLKSFKWLDCVIMESLRVLPPVPDTARRSTKDQWIDGVFVPKGTMFYIPIKIVNTWSELWGEDAEQFNPLRWLNLPPHYDPNLWLLSFLAGPHGCIGRTMAIMESKAILASLVANFEFGCAVEGQMPKPTTAVTMKPEDSMPLRVRLVRNSA